MMGQVNNVVTIWQGTWWWHRITCGEEKPDDIITLVFCHGMKPTKFQHYLITSTTLLHSTFVVCGKGLKPTDVKTIDSKEEFLKIVWDINRLEEVYSVLIYHAYDLLCIPLLKTNFINSIILSLIQLPFLVTPMYIRLMEKNTHLTEKVSHAVFLSLCQNKIKIMA